MKDLWTVALPSWATGVGTLVLAIATYFLLRQSRAELAQRRREVTLRVAHERLQQAELVSAWLGGPERLPSAPYPDTATSPVTVLNRSDEPIYEVVVTAVLVQGAGPRSGEDWANLSGAPNANAGRRAVLSMVPPGEWATYLDMLGMNVPQARFGAEIAFTDRVGVSWVRRADGRLEELRTNAIDHFRLGRPTNYQRPVPTDPTREDDRSAGLRALAVAVPATVGAAALAIQAWRAVRGNHREG